MLLPADTTGVKIGGGLHIGFGYGPIHDYHVTFWRQPRVEPENLPDGVTQERVMWAALECDISEATDLFEVLEWAHEEARQRQSIFSLYAIVRHGDEYGEVWLAGWNPTRSGEDFSRRQPAEIDPVSGTPSEVYGPRPGGSESDRPPLV